MQTVSIENDNGLVIEYGILALFSVNEDDTYIAVVPLNDKGEPTSADVRIFGYVEQEDEDDYDLYEIEDKEEYKRASLSFRDVLNSL